MLKFTILDRVIISFDNLLNTRTSNETNPATFVQNTQNLSTQEQKESMQMMRINHSGEICAQALYYGQALMARNTAQYNSLMTAAKEENIHLQWCEQRLKELNGKPSKLNPIWYSGSFAIGVLAGSIGDKISLGFLAETEYQVTSHIEKHLRKMSYKDQKSRAILLQMRNDELQHATNAIQAGGVELSGSIKFIMQCTAKILTVTAKWI